VLSRLPEPSMTPNGIIDIIAGHTGIYVKIPSWEIYPKGSECDNIAIYIILCVVILSEDM
jgi:hypothetical protein